MALKNEKEMVKTIVNLWHETVYGNMHKCMKKQHEFSDLMWGLYEELNGENNGK